MEDRGIFLYIVIFVSNNGILRWFIIAFAIVGAWIFHNGVGKFVVKYVSRGMNILINTVLKKPVKKVTMYIKNMVRKVFIKFSFRKGRTNEPKKKKFKKHKILK